MKRVLTEAFSRLPRGEQSRIADALLIRAQTVNKWAKGYNVPEPERWAQLEELLHLEPGALAAAAGFTPPSPAFDIAELVAEVQRQGAAIARIEARLARRAEPRSGEAPTRSREPAPTARRRKVDP